MKMTLSTNYATNLLLADKHAGWTREGATALVEYLEEIEESCGKAIEFDAVAIRCDYTEYASLDDFRQSHFGDVEHCLDELGADQDACEEELDELTRDYINDRGCLIEFQGGIIVSIV